MAVTLACTRIVGRRLRKPLLTFGSLKTSFTGPVVAGRLACVSVRGFCLPCLGGAVVSVATKRSGTLAVPIGSVTVDGATTVTDLGSMLPAKLRCADSQS